MSQENIPQDTRSYFKLSLFTKTNESSVHDQFTQYFDKVINSEKKIYYFFFYLFFNFFYKRFIHLVLADIEKLKNQWFLSNCNANDLIGLKGKSSQNYFNSLETQKIDSYMSSIEITDNWILNEYKKVRNEHFFAFLKKNFLFVIFWFVIIIFFFFYFVFSAKNSPYSIIEQIKVWLHFIVEGKS